MFNLEDVIQTLITFFAGVGFMCGLDLIGMERKRRKEEKKEKEKELKNAKK